MNYIVGYRLYCCEYSNNGAVVITIVGTSRDVLQLRRHADPTRRCDLDGKNGHPTNLYHLHVCHENADGVQDGSVKYLVEKLIYIPEIVYSFIRIRMPDCRMRKTPKVRQLETQILTL